MDYTIRPFNKTDVTGILKLINELAAFENASKEVEITTDTLLKYGFGPHAFFDCFVAEHNNELVGMALFYHRFSTWKGKTIHLEDLIVTQKYRGNGIGKALLTEVIHTAKKQGLKRVEWAVLDWNDSAIRFYEDCGALVDREWNTVQLNENQINNF
ncbi:MAG: N-acetyltransferase family protein [Bacteroidota bacterium]